MGMRFFPAPSEILAPAEAASTLEVELVAAPPPAPEPPPIVENRSLAAIDRKGLEKSEVKPVDAKFQSDEDMVAGTERAGKGLEPLPTQDGPDLPFVDFKTQTGASTGSPKEVKSAGESASTPAAPAAASAPLYKPKPLAKQYLEALAQLQKGATPAEATPDPSEPVPPVEPPKPPAPQLKAPVVDAPMPDEVPVSSKPPLPAPPPRPVPVPATATPPPKKEAAEMAKLVTPPPRPQAPREAGFTPDMRRTRIEGSISNRGKPGVDALRTPLGVYRRQVSQQIQSRWLYWTKKRMDLLAIGTVRIRFFVTQQGRVEDVEIVSNDSNESFAGVCEQSVREAEIAPPPADLELMKDGRLELVFSFTLYNTH
jgi:outer membrane biosynthesis protein TonB